MFEKASYYYKGEYNLPMRSLYGKKGAYTVYLHVHEEGSPEVELNLKFRDFLINNPEVREDYTALKKKAVQSENAQEMVSTGITFYNLQKMTLYNKY